MPVLSTLEILTKARDLIKNEENWTQGFAARDAQNNLVSTQSPEAVKFCAVGALYRVVKYDFVACDFAALTLLRKFARSKNMVKYNDRPGRKHSTILMAFDRAIARAQKETEKENKKKKEIPLHNQHTQKES